MLAFFTSEKGDAFRIITDTNQGIAEVGFLLVLTKIEPDQSSPDEDGEDRANACIAEKRHGQFPGNHPQDPEESAERDHGIDQREQIAEHARGERFYILRDTLIRIVYAVRAAQPVIGVVEKITPYQDIGHPFPPYERESLGRVPVKNPNRNRHGKGGKIDPEIAVKSGWIPLGQRGDEISPCVAHQDLQGTYRKAEQKDGADQHPGQKAVFGDKECLQKLGQPTHDAKMRGRVFGIGLCHDLI